MAVAALIGGKQGHWGRGEGVLSWVEGLGCVACVVDGHYALYSVGGAAAKDQEQVLNVVAAAALTEGKHYQQGM